MYNKEYDKVESIEKGKKL